MSLHFQTASTTEPAPTPAPVAVEQTVPQPVPDKTPTPAPRELDHTPGGLPVIPLAVITGNTTVAGLSALAVTAGPAAAAAAAGGLLVSAVAVRASGRRGARKAPRRPAPRPVQKKPTPVTRQSSSSSGNRTPVAPKQRSTTSGGSTGRRNTGLGSTGLAGGHKTATRRNTAANGTAGTGGKGTGTTLRKTHGAGTGTPKSGRGTTPKATPNAAGTKNTPKPPKNRASQIKALRKDKAATAPTRRERRTKDLADRRNLRDATRLNKRAARRDKNTPHTPGALNTPKTSARRNTSPISPATKTKPAVTVPIDTKKTGKAADTLRPTRTDKLRAKARTIRDQATETRAARIQQARNKAKARAKLAKTRSGARARYGVKAAGLGLLTAPVGLLGCLTTPLGKKLGWSWLQYPGRRLYRRLTATARYDRDARLADAANTYAYDTNPASLDTPDPAQPIGDTVARAPRTGNTPNLTGEPDMSEDIKLHFLDASADTVSAAQAYEPGGMLHVRQVIKAMPVALENWAMAFGVLAEKSDAEFPLGDEIGEGLDDIHQQMRQLISRAEDLAQTFDRIHEHDIERLTNPRKSAEAEKTWDTTANEDYDVD